MSSEQADAVLERRLCGAVVPVERPEKEPT